ncbi:MAG: fdrA domain protein [Alphaproteobacteria bacterium]|nr:fdrA domain protein [Alphaproteobacteria bacterium]
MRDGLRGTLLGRPLKVINVGLEGFAQDLERQGAAVVRVDWRPPAGGGPRLADLLSKLGT